MKKLISLFLCAALLLSVIPSAGASGEADIVILFENDVHCAVDGYSKLAAMKQELQQEYAYVGVVSAGDFLQGSSLGSVSRGGYIVELMNLVGYDALALGNHEFDYRMERLLELVEQMDTKPVCCNFRETGSDASFFAPYSVVSYGDVDIAYIGITTPSTIASSSPDQFLDEQGNYLYTFCPEELYSVVQESIDAATAEGADYVVALAHIGYREESDQQDVVDLIENTAGLDAVLDGHSHSVIEQMLLSDKEGNQVVLASAGTKFAYIGRLTVSDGEITTSLIPTESYAATDPAVDAYILQINDEYAQLGQRKIAVSEVDLITHDADGNRIVRTAQTNLGDLCADAFRICTGADISYVNGGGIRSHIPAGDVTFNDILNVFPFDNQMGVAEISGQVVLDMLEMALMSWPEEDGAYPHVSGLTFRVNTQIPSSVTVDEGEMFTGVAGAYRVYDVRVLNGETGVYEPLDPEKTYTIAAQNYFLQEFGSGMCMFADARILWDEGVLDLELLEQYIVEELGGVIGERYAAVDPRITFTEGEILPEEPETQPAATEPATPAEETAASEQTVPQAQQPAGNRTGWLLPAAVAVLLAAAVILFLLRRKKSS